MKYIWIWILVIIDIIWLISSIKDVIVTVRRVKKDKFYITYYGGICNSIISMLNSYTVGFISVHLIALFVVSFGVWLGSLK